MLVSLSIPCRQSANEKSDAAPDTAIMDRMPVARSNVFICLYINVSVAFCDNSVCYRYIRLAKSTINCISVNAMTNLLLYGVTVLIWGSTWFAIEFQLGTVAIEVSLAYRYLIAAALMFAWCGMRRLPLHFDGVTHRYFLLMGCFLFGLNYLAAYAAQIYITSALNAIGFSAMLWMNIVNARVFLGRRIARRTYIGAILGIVGIFILFWPEIQDVSWSDRVLIGAMISLSGAYIASIGNIVSHAAQQKKIPVMQSNAWGMLYGGLLNSAAALVQGKSFAFDTSPGYVISLLFLSVFGSVVAFGCYLTLLGRIGVERAGYAVVMFPMVAVVLSALFEGLELELHIYVGVGLALAGNVAILGAGPLLQLNGWRQRLFSQGR
jgi:drug/metabolite transporter (DMT)-like permease